MLQVDGCFWSDSVWSSQWHQTSCLFVYFIFYYYAFLYFLFRFLFWSIWFCCCVTCSQFAETMSFQLSFSRRLQFHTAKSIISLFHFFHGTLRPQHPRGLLGTGNGGVRGGLYTYRYTVTSHFNVLLTVRVKVTRQCSQTTTFLKRKESRSGVGPRPFCLPA